MIVCCCLSFYRKKILESPRVLSAWQYPGNINHPLTRTPGSRSGEWCTINHLPLLFWWNWKFRSRCENFRKPCLAGIWLEKSIGFWQTPKNQLITTTNCWRIEETAYWVRICRVFAVFLRSLREISRIRRIPDANFKKNFELLLFQ